MKKNKIKKFNGIKSKNIWPFYIDHINDKFFESLSNHPNKVLVNKVLPKIQKNLDEDELEKFNEINNLTKNSKIMMMLNLALKKIVSKTGSKDCDLFQVLSRDKFNEPNYIQSLTFESDNYSKWNNSKFDNDRKYDYLIQINKKSYLKKYIDNIQLSFFLDDKIKLLSGGFSLNSEYIATNDSTFIDIVEKVYMSSLIKHFISNQLYPLSLENLLIIISNGNESFNVLPKKQNNKQNNVLKYDEITIYDLKDNWVNFINRKFLNFFNFNSEQKEYFEHHLFFSILIVNLIILSLYEELRIYFVNENPEIILSLLDKPHQIKEDPNQNIETDFYELAKFLDQNYFSTHKKIKTKKITTANELIQALKLQKNYDEFSFGKPILSSELYLNQYPKKPTAQDVFESDFELKTLYLMVISPEVFGMDIATGNFIEYGQILKIIKQSFVNNKKATSSFNENLEKSKCEFNYEFMSFVGAEPSMLIMKNNTFVDNNTLYTNEDKVLTGLFENYFWSQIFIQSRLWKRIHIEQDFINNYTCKEPHFYSNQIKDLERLGFNWYDDYYGMNQIKPIIDKIDEIIKLKNSIENLRIKIIQKNELIKKDKERWIVLFAYIIATLIGFINFFGMVYTILTVDDPKKGINPASISIITIGSIFAFVLFSILVYFLVITFKPLLKKLKNKN